MKSEVVIAHLSDLHHPSIQGERWNVLKKYLTGRRPDLILVTGDLTNHPWPWRHSQVKDKLKELLEACQQAGKQDVKLFVIPGNHDTAFWGNVGFFLLRQLSFDRAFKGFQEKFFEESVGNSKVYFFCFNSNPFIAKWAKGAVSKRQLRWFQGKLDELQSKDAEGFNESYKVAILHHHPMPIPHDKKLESYLFLKNAGEFIESMAQNRINLILHGHKHKSRISYVSLGTTSTSRNIAIVACGSTLKDGEDNACNLITIFENMRAEVRQVFAKPGEDFEEKSLATHLPDWDTYMRERYEMLKNELGYEIESLSRLVIVDDEGDGNTLVSVKGLQVTSPQRFKGVAPFEQKVDAGSIARIRLYAEGDFKNMIRVVEETPGSVKLIVTLPAADTNPHSFKFDYWTLNSWALNTEEWDRKYKNKKDIPRHSEDVNFEFMRPIGMFHVEVQLPPNCKVHGEPKLVIYPPAAEGDSPEPVRDLQKHLRTALKFSPKRNVILMSLAKPLCGFRYVVQWYLTSPPSAETPVYRREAEQLISELWLRRQLDVFKNPLIAVEKMIREKFQVDDGETIDVTLAIPIPEEGSLEFISSNLSNHPAIGERLSIGDGTGGRAFKENSIRLYREDKVDIDDPKSNVYVTIGDYAHKVLYSVPIVHPVDGKQVIAILSVGSQRQASALLPVADGIEREKEKIAEVARQIVSFANVYLLKRLSEECRVEISYSQEPERVDNMGRVE